MTRQLKLARQAADIREKRLSADRVIFLKARLAHKRAAHRGVLLNPVMWGPAPFRIKLEAAE